MAVALGGGSTAQRQGEPAWHRRQRRLRGNARALLRVAAAARLTACHHSAQRHRGGWHAAAAAASFAADPMPNAAAGSKGGKGGGAPGGHGGKGAQGDRPAGAGAGPRPGDWPCTICGSPDNRAWRTRCRVCDAYRNRAMANAMATAAKPKTNFAERQLQQQRAAQKDQRREEAEKKRLRDANAKLAAEVAALKAQQTQQQEADDEDEEMEEDGDDEAFEHWTEESRAKRVELAKGGLAYAVDKFGEDSAEANELRREIALVQRASRQAKPFKAHRAQLERRRDRLQKQQDRDEGELEKTQSEISELQAKVDTLRTAIEERTKAIKEVTSELTELVRKSIAEGAEEEGGGPPPGPLDDSPWGKMSSAIKGLEAVPGLPPELVTLLARVQEATAVMATMANPAGQQGRPNGTAQPGSGQPAAVASSALSAAPSPVPVVLAPHGRFARGSAKEAVASPPKTGPLQPQNSNGAEGGCQRGDKGGTSTAASSAGPGASDEAASKAEGMAAEAAGGGPPGDAGEDDDPMHVEIETSLAKLPEGDQQKLRAALDKGRNRSRVAERADMGEGSTRRDERERSPRNVKGSEDKEL